MAIQVRTLRTLLLWAAILCPAVAIIAGLLAPTWPEQRGHIFYNAPLFFIGPLWLRLRFGERPLQWDTLWVLDLGVFALAVLRYLLGSWLPFSGHMLFLTYSVLTTPTLWYRVLGMTLALEVAWFHLVLWHTQRIFWPGVVGGSVAGLVFMFVRSRGRSTSD